MVELSVLGISLQGEGSVPVLLLHPHGTEQILSLSIGPMEAFAISTALQSRQTGAENATPAAAWEDPSPAPVQTLGNLRFHNGRLEAHPETPAGPPTEKTTQKFSEKEREQGSLFPRPMTHDLMLRLMHALGGRLLGVELLRVVDGVFLAEAVLSTGTTIVRVDCRPSDGIALAIRCGALLRATEAVLAYAEDIAQVMESLPEHVRTVAAAGLAAEAIRSRAQSGSQADNASPDFSRIPLIVEAALTAKNKFLEADKKRSVTITVSGATAATGTSGVSGTEADREISLRPVSEPDSITFSVPHEMLKVKRGPSISASAGEKKTGPNIRVSLIRQGKKGESELLDEFRLPVDGIPKEVLETLSSPILRPDADAGEDDRWAVLLRILSPETKVLM